MNYAGLVWNVAMFNSLRLLRGTAVPMNSVEYFFFLIALTFGTFLYAWISAIFVKMITTGNPDEQIFSARMDALNYMMSDTHMPTQIRMRVRDYFRKTKVMMKRISYDALIDQCLSHELRGEARFLISINLFAQVSFLCACERDFLEDLCLKIKREAFSASSPIPVRDELMILVVGVCSRAGIIITAGAEGAAWGDVLLSAPKLRDTRAARALTYCEVARISRDDLFEVAQSYPESMRVLREAGLRLATWRAVMVISAFTRMMKKRATEDGALVRLRSGGSLSPSDLEDGPAQPSDFDEGGKGREEMLRMLHNHVFSRGLDGVPFREADEIVEVKIDDTVWDPRKLRERTPSGRYEEEPKNMIGSSHLKELESIKSEMRRGLELQAEMAAEMRREREAQAAVQAQMMAQIKQEREMHARMLDDMRRALSLVVDRVGSVEERAATAVLGAPAVLVAPMPASVPTMPTSPHKPLSPWRKRDDEIDGEDTAPDDLES